MEHQIIGKPDFSLVKVRLAPQEKVLAEAGAMVTMSGGVSIETKAKGGVLAGLKRKLGGESFFVNTFSADATGGEVLLAPATPGDLQHVVLKGGPFYLQSRAFVASDPRIVTDFKWGGAKSFFGGEGLFMLQCSGEGDLWFGSYGAIHPVDVEGSYVVDTGAIVAFESSLTFGVKSVGGLKSLMFSGEGLVCEFKGNGRLWLQTRLPASFASWIHPFRPKKQSKN